MGMDVMHYEVVRPVHLSEYNPELNKYGYYDIYRENVEYIEINDRALVWMNFAKIGTEFIRTVKEFDWTEWMKENAKYENYDFLDFQVNSQSEPHWIQIQDEEGETVLLDSGFKYKEKKFLLLEAKTIGYMRKPFRHNDTPSEINDGSLNLRVTNFSNNGELAFEELRKIDASQTNDANVYVFDKEQINNLKNYSFDKVNFQKQLMDGWKPNQYVLFNW